jgi:DDB1- and CUL4-associated factor 5
VHCLVGHRSNIFSARFCESDTHVVSGGNDHRVYYHDVQRAQPLIRVEGHVRAVLSVDFVPESAVVFASAGMDQYLHLWDARAGMHCVASRLSTGGVFSSVHFNRVRPHLAVVTSQEGGTLVLDMRMLQRCGGDDVVVVHRFAPEDVKRPPTHARWNHTGTRICCSIENGSPLLLNARCKVVCRFEDDAYSNRLTMKGVSFAGHDDGWVVAGSDDFRVYVWRCEEAEDGRTARWEQTSHGGRNSADGEVSVVRDPQILLGHRSVVNTVLYHKAHNMLFSAGTSVSVWVWVGVSVCSCVCVSLRLFTFT